MNIVEVEELRCQLGGTDVLKGVSLTIERGDILAVLGANGAGKAMLVKVLATLIPARSGTVRINGSS
ncbi:MAG: ATP-binding cassette domain-containing protein, partial [Flaviflexus sp.]|nr:ATP-binding cassette domain-containing protein [Flaviflexus sp.]